MKCTHECMHSYPHECVHYIVANAVANAEQSFCDQEHKQVVGMMLSNSYGSGVAASVWWWQNEPPIHSPNSLRRCCCWRIRSRGMLQNCRGSRASAASIIIRCDGSSGINMYSADDFEVQRLLGTYGYMNITRFGNCKERMRERERERFWDWPPLI